MYAIIERKGNQYFVEKDKVILIPGCLGKIGEEIEFPIIFKNTEEGYKREGKAILQIMEITKGKKLISIKYKRRKNYRRKIGHRTLYTQLLVKDII